MGMKVLILYSTKKAKEGLPRDPNWQLFARIKYTSRAMMIHKNQMMNRTNGGVTRR